MNSPVYTKHLYNISTMLDQRRRRLADVVQMLYKCVVFAGSCVHNHHNIVKAEQYRSLHSKWNIGLRPAEWELLIKISEAAHDLMFEKKSHVCIQTDWLWARSARTDA